MGSVQGNRKDGNLNLSLYLSLHWIGLDVNHNLKHPAIPFASVYANLPVIIFYSRLRGLGMGWPPCPPGAARLDEAVGKVFLNAALADLVAVCVLMLHAATFQIESSSL
jgi:hypothetical protein